MKTRIAEYRKRMGLTQEQLAQKVEATRQTIIALEQGRYNPSLQLAYKITKALGAEHIEELFELKDS